jgi:hypothetical protein
MKGLADSDRLISKLKGRILRREMIIKINIRMIIILSAESQIQKHLINVRPEMIGRIKGRNLRGKCLALNRIKIKKS